MLKCNGYYRELEQKQEKKCTTSDINHGTPWQVKTARTKPNGRHIDN